MANSIVANGRMPGHRQRLREHFLADAADTHTDGALLELLLTYAIPQQDVAPLARALLTRFGDLASVLSADADALVLTPGIKENTAALLKVVDYIRQHLASGTLDASVARGAPDVQLPLFDQVPVASPMTMEQALTAPRTSSVTHKNTLPIRPRSDLFANAALEDAVQSLPQLPDADSLDDIRTYLRDNLHFNSRETRARFGSYVAKRMFPSGQADHALLAFARRFAARQELRDVCYYRFCVAEPLMMDVAEQLLLPAMGTGSLERARVRDYLANRFPTFKSVVPGVRGIADALKAGGVARVDKNTITVAYRDILLPSFAFVLHSEFPEPGMYNIAKVEQNSRIRAMLWNPEHLLPALYELRNRGMLSKVSDIDTVRQFTTRLNLEQTVAALVAEGSSV